MHKFIIRLLIFLIPFILILAINIVIDPFEYFNGPGLGFDKKDVSLPLDYRLYKLNSYRKHPLPNILLGDSRIAAISTGEIEKVSGRQFYNFAYGGGTLEEALNTIDYASEICKLKEIVIGIPFNLFDASNSRESVTQSIKIIKNPSSYFFNYKTSRASLYCCVFMLTGKNPVSENPKISKQDFWIRQLKMSDATYSNYSYPNNYEKKLIELSRWCKEHNVSFKVIIPPTHADLQNKITEHHLKNEYDKYKQFLHTIAQVYDYETINYITTDSENFKDPYHFSDQLMNMIVADVWGSTWEENKLKRYRLDK